jgi:hypothetical protein
MYVENKKVLSISDLKIGLKFLANSDIPSNGKVYRVDGPHKIVRINKDGSIGTEYKDNSVSNKSGFRNSFWPADIVLRCIEEQQWKKVSE